MNETTPISQRYQAALEKIPGSISLGNAARLIGVKRDTLEGWVRLGFISQDRSWHDPDRTASLTREEVARAAWVHYLRASERYSIIEVGDAVRGNPYVDASAVSFLEGWVVEKDRELILLRPRPMGS